MTKPTDTQLQIVPTWNQAVARPLPNVADMLQAVIEKGVSSENVAAVEQLVKLFEHMEERNAEKAFAQAFVALQAEMPKVNATKVVPNKDGTPRYAFAPFEDIMSQVGPMLQRHGFTVSFSQRYDAQRLVKICTLQHVGGHKRTSEFAVRISAPPGASETQGDGSSATYAKRFALCDCLNIVIAHLDDDARADGGTITAEQASDLRSRLRNVAGNEAAFLNFAGASKFEEISSVKLEMLEEFLAKKERIYMSKLEGKQ